MPDIYKIGCTTQNIETRVSQLSRSTSIPCDFNIVAFAEFDDCQSAEKELHEWMSKYKYGKEYFKFTYEDLITYACYVLMETEELGCNQAYMSMHYYELLAKF